jgi:hypothetical protein
MRKVPGGFIIQLMYACMFPQQQGHVLFFDLG